MNYANIIKLMLSDEYGISDYMIEKINIEPITKTKFKKYRKQGLKLNCIS